MAVVETTINYFDLSNGIYTDTRDFLSKAHEYLLTFSSRAGLLSRHGRVSAAEVRHEADPHP